MKKIIAMSLVGAASVCALASCGEKVKYDVIDNTCDSTNLYTTYLSGITFDTKLNEAEVTERDAASKSYYDVRISSSSERFVNVMDASRLSSKKDIVRAKYASTASWDKDDYEDIIEYLTDNIDGVFADYLTKVEFPEGYFDTNKEERVLCVVYQPVYVTYCKYQSKKLLKTTKSYVLAPVYASLTTKANDVIADNAVSAYTDMTFTVKKGKIQ